MFTLQNSKRIPFLVGMVGVAVVIGFVAITLFGLFAARDRIARDDNINNYQIGGWSIQAATRASAIISFVVSATSADVEQLPKLSIQMKNMPEKEIRLQHGDDGRFFGSERLDMEGTWIVKVTLGGEIASFPLTFAYDKK